MVYSVIVFDRCQKKLYLIYAILVQEMSLPAKGGPESVFGHITEQDTGLGFLTPSEKIMAPISHKTGRQILEYASKWWHIPVMIAILWYGIDARLHRYGDLSLSIGTNDTGSYLRTSQAPLLSKKFLIGERSITIPLLYKLLYSKDGYELRLVSLPGEEDQVRNRGIQAGFSKVVRVQLAFGIIAWVCFALLVARRIKTRFVKVIWVAIIVFFAFTPPIADWDSILESESLSISLFALSLGLITETAFNFASDLPTKPWWRYLTLGLCVFVIALWGYSRDANYYAVLVALLLIIPLFLFKSFRKNRPLIVFCVCLAGVFAFGFFSSQVSMRWKVPLQHIYRDMIITQSRAGFFESRGMPDPDSPEFDRWFDNHASIIYGFYLLSHPQYTFPTLINDLSYLFSENVQPYFIADRKKYRQQLLLDGDTLHVKSGGVFWIDLLMLGCILLIAWKRPSPHNSAWAWLAMWLFLSALVILFLSYYADSIGVIRHVLSAVVMYRLSLWLYLVVILDYFVTLPRSDPGQTVFGIRKRLTEPPEITP